MDPNTPPPPSLNTTDFIAGIRVLRDLEEEKATARQLVRATNDNLTNLGGLESEAFQKSQPMDLPGTPPDPNALSPMDELVHQSFMGMDKRQQLSIINGFILTHGKDITKNLDLQKSEFELEKDKRMFELKTLFAKVVGGSLILMALALVGVFVYVALKQGILADGGVIVGLFNTIQEVFKVIFTTPIS